MAQDEQRKPRGRPRSASAARAVTNAVQRLLARGVTLQALSIEAVAKEARVGKATIYRAHPAGKSSLALDILLAAPEVRAPLPPLKTHTDAVAAQLKKLLHILSSARLAPLFAQLMAEAVGDAKAQEALSARFLGPLRGALAASVAEGQKAGEFGSGLEPQVAVDALVGGPLFRVLSTAGPLEATFCDAWAAVALDLVVRGAPRAALAGL
ncbi:MAG TPA: hypothetical protein DDX54_05010 [Rhodospirillaceae bacterium]|jgi:AcrR family transcriptional regulator|nr:TetR/AcrR family transcriptional regulator C-terminal ligand-binding domain-containing protein [Alphaproteobacteria bacterium]HBH26741.1 hypothetical protein [Rhodospirillaceae bacterium]